MPSTYLKQCVFHLSTCLLVRILAMGVVTVSNALACFWEPISYTLSPYIALLQGGGELNSNST